jgi:hypothetical protein
MYDIVKEAEKLADRPQDFQPDSLVFENKGQREMGAFSPKSGGGAKPCSTCYLSTGGASQPIERKSEQSEHFPPSPVRNARSRQAGNHDIMSLHL